MPFMGRPAFPFIDEGEEQIIDRKREKSQGEEGLEDRRVLLLYAGPADAVDGDRDGSTLGSCSPLVPHPVSSAGNGVPSCPGG